VRGRKQGGKEGGREKRKWVGMGGLVGEGGVGLGRGWGSS